MPTETVEFVSNQTLCKYVAYYGKKKSPYRDGMFSYKVAAGGAEKGLACVLLSAEKNDEGKWAVNLDSLHNYSECTEPLLARGWAADLLRAACKRVFGILGGNIGGDGISLQDESATMCGRTEADMTKFLNRAGLVSISLGHHNMMVHGATWYERKLGARPGNEHCRDARDGWIRHIESQVPAGGPSAVCAALKRAAPTLLPNELRYVEAALMLLQKPPKTWRDVYAAIDDADNGCMLFGKLDAAAQGIGNMMSLRGKSFTIPLDIVRSWPDANAAPTSVRGGARSVVDRTLRVMAKVRLAHEA